MKKKTMQSWITFEKKIMELENQKLEMMNPNTKFQEERKLAIVDALLRNDFDGVTALSQEIKEQQSKQIAAIEEKVNFFKDRQQKIREAYNESPLKDNTLYMHAVETDDKEIIELFRQRKVSEELYQQLMDTYYSTHFDARKDEKWTPDVSQFIHKKNKPIQPNQDIKNILKEMKIWYNEERVTDFYEPDNQETVKVPTKKPSIQMNFIKEWNIIKELLTYVQACKVILDPSDIILDKKGTTMYIYIPWMDKTVIISNIYGVWTHIYKGKVAIKEIQDSTISSLCDKYKGKKINFWLDFWWIEGRKSRLIKTLKLTRKELIEQTQKELIESMTQETQPTEQITTVSTEIQEENWGILRKIEEWNEEGNDGNQKKRFWSLREKIDYFSADKGHLDHKTLNFDTAYSAITTSVVINKEWPWAKVYVHIGKNIFGYYVSKNTEDITKIKLWDIVNVRAKRIGLEGKPIFFHRPE